MVKNNDKETSYELGKKYEIFINNYLNTLPTTSVSYLWADAPTHVLEKANLITNYNKTRVNVQKPQPVKNINNLKDIGIDIILINKDNKIIFVQCKNYKTTLCVDHLAGFWMIMANHTDKSGIVFHSNSKISRNITEQITNKRIQFVEKAFVFPTKNETIKKNTMCGKFASCIKSIFCCCHIESQH
jgi:hypothetical protein